MKNVRPGEAALGKPLLILLLRACVSPGQITSSVLPPSDNTGIVTTIISEKQRGLTTMGL